MNLFFSCGDINGIGPEIVIKTLSFLSKQNHNHKLFIPIPGNVLEYYVTQQRIDFPYNILDLNFYINKIDTQINFICFENYNFEFGRATKESGRASLRSLGISFDFYLKNVCDALITAPISKEALKKANANYMGHTDMLATWCNKKNYAMVFIGKDWKASPATIHIPLKKVVPELMKKNLKDYVQLLKKMLITDFNISKPKIALLGINPHAGENGVIGNEEKDLLTKLIKYNSETLYGPFPADAFFANKRNKKFDLVIGWYHDQVLIPFKMENFSDGVNYTAGLPLVRTSPDHGTAYDIANKWIADNTSMISAFYWAVKIVSNRQHHAKI